MFDDIIDTVSPAWEAMTVPALNTPVQMLSVCDVDGRLRPLRFRYEDGQHQLQTVQVREVLVARELSYVGLQVYQYVCKAACNGLELLFELRYTVRTHRWVLYRMIN